MKFPVRQVFLLFGLLLAVGACQNDGDIDKERVLTRGIITDPETLDPHKYLDKDAGTVLRDIGEGLTRYDFEGRIAAGVASDWQVSDDGTVYDFELRKDARWSDGSPVVAADFAFAFTRLVDPENAFRNADRLLPILNATKILEGTMPRESLGISANDDGTLTITLERPTPYLLSLLAHPSMYPIKSTDSVLFGPAFSEPASSVSNGPYQLKSRRFLESIELVRNQFYWNNANTFFDVVVYKALPTDVQSLQFRAGELDLTSNVDTATFSSLRRDDNDAVVVSPALGVYFYGFNLRRPPFQKNLALRKALSVAIDRHAIVEKITGKGELPAFSFVPPGIDNYDLGLPSEHEQVKHSASYAKALLTESEFIQKEPLEIRFNAGDSHERIALTIQAMWRERLGLMTKLNSQEFKLFLSSLKSDDSPDLFRLSWTADFNDAESFLTIFETGAANNFTGYSSSEFDGLMERSRDQVDPEKRNSLLKRAEEVLIADHAVIPLYFYVNKHLVGEGLKGVSPSPLGIIYSNYLYRDIGPKVRT